MPWSYKKLYDHIGTSLGLLWGHSGRMKVSMGHFGIAHLVWTPVLAGVVCFDLKARPFNVTLGTFSTTVWDGLEIKPHLGGHWENTQPLVTDQLELSNTLTSTQCCALAVSSATHGTHQACEIPKTGVAAAGYGMQIVKKTFFEIFKPSPL